MSPNDTDDESRDVEHRGPELRLNAHASGYGGQFPYSRSTIGSMGDGHDPNSLKLYDALNYPHERDLDFDTWLSYYHREGQIAGVLDKLVTDTWQGGAPPVTDDDATGGEDDEEDTQFERDVQALSDHGTDLDLRAPLLDRLIAADILATLGEYAVLVFGFDDDNAATEPLEEGSIDTDGTDLSGLDYVEVYAENAVDFDLVDDLDDPRHGRPEAYEVGDSSHEVHHSRVVHVAENTLVDPYSGIPFFKPIANLIVNIQKILGASGEGYFRAGYPGLAITAPPSFKNLGSDTNPNIQKVPGSFGDDVSALESKIERSFQHFERVFATNADITSLTPNITDPAPHMDVQWEGIAAAKDLPQSILKGNETGERATTEDSASLRRRVSGRRNSHAETRLYRPTLDLLTFAGVIADPEGGGYTVDWPPLSEPTDEELAARHKTQADTFATGAQAFGQPPGTPAEFRKQFLDWSPERGSEAPDATAQQDAVFETDARTIMDRMDFGGESRSPGMIALGDTGGVPDATSPAATDGGVTAGESRVNADADGDDETDVE